MGMWWADVASGDWWMGEGQLRWQRVSGHGDVEGVGWVGNLVGLEIRWTVLISGGGSSGHSARSTAPLK